MKPTVVTHKRRKLGMNLFRCGTLTLKPNRAYRQSLYRHGHKLVTLHGMDNIVNLMCGMSLHFFKATMEINS